MGGVAGVGLLAFVLALCVMFWWNDCWPKVATYLMIVAGLCLAIAGAGPLVRVGDFIETGSNQAAGWFGAAGVGLAIVTIVLTIHVARVLWPAKNGARGAEIKRSHQWSAFFAPGLFIAAGGVGVIVAQLVTAAETAGDQISTFIGG